MSGASRMTRLRRRRTAGRCIVKAEVDEVSIEALLEAFLVDTVEELLELLINIDTTLVTRHAVNLANVLLFAVNELTPDEE